MTPVLQTHLGEEGNCLAACVVSILDAPELLDELTEVLEGITAFACQRMALAPWLQERGMTCVPIMPWDEHFHEDMRLFLKDVICIASGISPRGHGHGVVWQNGIVHDPYPDGGGFAEGKEPYAFTLIVPMEKE